MDKIKTKQTQAQKGGEGEELDTMEVEGGPANEGGKTTRREKRTREELDKSWEEKDIVEYLVDADSANQVA